MHGCILTYSRLYDFILTYNGLFKGRTFVTSGFSTEEGWRWERGDLLISASAVSLCGTLSLCLCLCLSLSLCLCLSLSLPLSLSLCLCQCLCNRGGLGGGEEGTLISASAVSLSGTLSVSVSLGLSLSLSLCLCVSLCLCLCLSVCLSSFSLSLSLSACTHLLVGVAVVGLPAAAEDLPQDHAVGPGVRLTGETAVFHALRGHPAHGQHPRAPDLSGREQAANSVNSANTLNSGRRRVKIIKQTRMYVHCTYISHPLPFHTAFLQRIEHSG